MGVAAMVRGQVAEQAHPTGVQCIRQPGQGSIPAELRVDTVERRCVVAMVRPGREYRAQVDGVGACAGDVIEVGGDPIQVAAIKQVRGLWSIPDDRIVPTLGGPPTPGPAGLLTWRNGPGRSDTRLHPAPTMAGRHAR